MEASKSLREKIFEACNLMASENQKITRDTVREVTGGSNRDVGLYLSEWKEEYQKSALVLSTNHELSQQEQESAAISPEGAPSAPSTAPGAAPTFAPGAYTSAPQDDLALVARRGAERAAAIMMGENAVTEFLLENPDKLPSDLRQQVEAAQARSAQAIERRQQQYNSDFFVQKAIAQFQ